MDDFDPSLVMVEQLEDYAIFGISLDGRITSWNRGVLTAFGYSAEAFVGLPLAELYLPHDRSAGVPDLEMEGARERGSSGSDRWLLHRDGSRFWAANRISGVIGADSQLIGYTKVVRNRSDLRQESSDLRTAADRYRTLVDTASDAILTIGEDSTILFANTAVERVFGYRAEELVGQSLTVLMPADLQDRHRHGIGRYLQSGRRTLDWSSIRLPGCHRDGRAIQLEVSFGESSDADEHTFTGIVRDVSERAAADQALHEAEARARAIFEQSPLATLIFNPDGSVVAVNSAWELLWGATLQDAPPGYRLQHDPQLLAAGFGPLLERALAGDSVMLPALRYDMERATLRRGRTIWVQGYCYPLRSDGGEIRSIVVIQIDVTDLRESESALQASEARFRAALEAVSDILWTNDAEGRMRGVQPQWAAFTGQSREEYQGYGWADAVHPDDAQPTIDAWEACVRERREFHHEHRVRRADGAYRVCAIRAVPVPNPDGSVREWVGVHSDITERVRAESQLAKAQRMQAVGTLAGGVAHEVNNQLTAILGFGEFVTKSLGPDHSLSDDMRQIVQAAIRAAKVAQQLLAFSRQQVTQFAPVELSGLIKESAPLLRQVLGADKSLTLTPPATPVVVRADRMQLEQVLINLIANARDAMAAGRSATISIDRVELTASSSVAHGSVLTVPGWYGRITVSDEGGGMDAATLGRVFEPFFTTKPVGQGTGLGLAMAYGIVKRHGGFIWAYSEPGIGTAIKMYLPEDAAAPQRGDDSDETLREAAPAIGCILIAEDEPAVRSIASRALREEGFTVLEASDGRAALELLEAQPKVALVIADLIMPEMGGASLGEELAMRRPEIPVLYISGFAGDEALRRQLVPDGMPFLQKPFRIEDIVMQVRSLLGLN